MKRTFLSPFRKPRLPENTVHPEPSPSNKPAKALVLLIGEVLEDPRVLRTCQSLRDSGVEVTVGCTRLSGRAPREEWEGLRIIRFPHRKESLLKRGYLWFQGKIRPEYSGVFARAHEEAPASGIRTALRNLALSLNFRTYLRNTLRINRAMVRAFSGGAFDLVHCNDADTLSAGSALKRCGAAREMLYDAHEYWPGMGVTGSAANDSIRRLESAGIANADYVTTVNPLIADMLQRDYRLAGTPAVVMNCPRLDTGAEPPDAVHRPVRVLYQGKVQAFRGVEQLVLAFRLLEGAELTVAGDGPLLDRCRLLAVSEGLEDRVHFTGRYEPGDTLSIVREHDIGVLPFSTATLSITYSSPNKLFDYAMGGLAIASSDLPFMRTVIGECDMGALFPDNRPESIAEALREMIRDPERLRECKRNARRAAIERFSWEKQFGGNYPWKKDGPSTE